MTSWRRSRPIEPRQRRARPNLRLQGREPRRRGERVLAVRADPDLLKKMLPMLAMLVAGYMAKQRGGAPAPHHTGLAVGRGARRPAGRAARRRREQPQRHRRWARLDARHGQGWQSPGRHPADGDGQGIAVRVDLTAGKDPESGPSHHLRRHRANRLAERLLHIVEVCSECSRSHSLLPTYFLTGPVGVSSRLSMIYRIPLRPARLSVLWRRSQMVRQRSAKPFLYPGHITAHALLSAGCDIQHGFNVRSREYTE